MDASLLSRHQTECGGQGGCLVWNPWYPALTLLFVLCLHLEVPTEIRVSLYQVESLPQRADSLHKKDKEWKMVVVEGR